jgi:hypothetical protein
MAPGCSGGPFVLTFADPSARYSLNIHEPVLPLKHLEKNSNV